MLHEINLWHSSFEKVKSGAKTIEMRLNDEKRSLVKIGDTIEFTDTSNGRKCRCSVLDLFRYASFEALYQNHNKMSLGYEESEPALPSDMLTYYSEDEIKKQGVVGIEIRVI